jgi:hypothetical protein
MRTKIQKKSKKKDFKLMLIKNLQIIRLNENRKKIYHTFRK